MFMREISSHNIEKKISCFFAKKKNEEKCVYIIFKMIGCVRVTSFAM